MRYNFAEIGERIRLLRKSSGMNQDCFIEALNDRGVKVGRNRISCIENGERKHFSLAILLETCEIFGCDMGYLLGEYKERTRELREISNITGLSEASIIKLQKLKTENRATAYSDLLSILIEHDNTEYFLAMIGQRISYFANKRKLSGTDPVVKDMIDRTLSLDIDGIRTAVYKDSLIDSLLQTELVKLLSDVSNEYLIVYSETPEQRRAIWNDYSRELILREKSGEITEEQRKEKIDSWMKQ